MDNNLMLVFSNPVAGQDDAYNTWYDDVHLGDVLQVPGVVGAKRFTLVEMPSPDGESAPVPAHRYLAVYQLDRQPAEVMAELMRRVESGAMRIDDSLAQDSIGLTAWRQR